MKFPKINLHIHSNFSDGKSSIKNIVEKALKLDMDYIAITDHFTNSWKAHVIRSLDCEEKINEYLTELSIHQTNLIHNNSKLKLFKGIEVDLESSETFIKELINPNKFEIILFEYLETIEGISFIEEIINYWKESYHLSNDLPIFGLAHFDPSYFIYGALDTLMELLKENNIYFEFNARYPEFFSQKYKIFYEELKKRKLPILIGCDSHNTRKLDDIDELIEMIKFYELEDNLMKCLEFLRK